MKTPAIFKRTRVIIGTGVILLSLAGGSFAYAATMNSQSAHTSSINAPTVSNDPKVNEQSIDNISVVEPEAEVQSSSQPSESSMPPQNTQPHPATSPNPQPETSVVPSMPPKIITEETTEDRAFKGTPCNKPGMITNVWDCPEMRKNERHANLHEVNKL